MNKTISVVIPAYNEEEVIAATLEAVKVITGVTAIIVMNDGSTDGTSGVARRLGAQVVDLYPNRGKGGAMNASLAYVNTDVVVFLDADLGSSAREAEKLLQPVLQEQCDLAIASFPPPAKKGGFGLVKGTAARAIRKRGGSQAVSPLSGQRAMTRQALDILAPFNEGYGVELGMTLKALQHGLRVVEVPTVMRHKETGRNLEGFKHRGRQFLDVVRVLADARRKGI